MIRYVLAAAAVAIGVTTVMAQDASVTARRAVMKAYGTPHYGVLGGMAQGRTPFNQDQVNAALTAIAENVAKVPGVFPAESNKGPDAGSDYYATQAAFTPQGKADIEAKVAAVLKAINDNRPKIKDQETARAAFTEINGACNACHAPYRARKS